jgi:hypothetical protein
MNLSGQLVGFLSREIGPMKGLYLHRTTHHRKMRTGSHALSGILTHDSNVRAAEDSTCLRHVARMGEGRGVYRVWVTRPEGKRPLGRPRRRWEDNIKMDLREIGIDGANWTRLAQDRVQWRAFVKPVIIL